MSPHPSVPSYPLDLQRQMFHAARFARALRVLQEDAVGSDATLLWLEGRADEVVVFTADILDAWSAGQLTTSIAIRSIEVYLQGLHHTLEGWYGKSYAPSCCAPLASVQAEGARKRLPPRPSASPARRRDTVPRVNLHGSLPESGARACSRANLHGSLADTMSDSTVVDLRLGDRGDSPGALASPHAMV